MNAKRKREDQATAPMSTRPTGGNGSFVTTPMAATMLELLGGGCTVGSVVLSTSEFDRVRRLYGYEVEQPTPRPAPPAPPVRVEFTTSLEYEAAVRAHEAALKTHAKWQDPLSLMQAGADRNAIRHAECDGLRLLAWIAKYVSPGEDPLKHLIQLAVDAGWDVDPSDAEWAEREEA